MRFLRIFFLMFLLLAGGYYEIKNHSISHAVGKIIPALRKKKDSIPIVKEPLAFKENPAEQKEKNADGLLKMAGFGGVKYGMDSVEVCSLLGNPESKTEPVFWKVSGKYYYSWLYPQKGVTLEMEAGADSLSVVHSMYIYSPSNLKDIYGLGVGSREDEIKTRYKEWIDSVNTDNATIVAGPLSGGLVFSVENRRITGIFLGASME